MLSEQQDDSVFDEVADVEKDLPQSSELQSNGTLTPPHTSVDLDTPNDLTVDISDALSERDKVKFTIHTKTTLTSDFAESEFTVERQHEEFIWLHSMLNENETYAGVIIPPAPPKPDFDASREKLQKLGEGQGVLTKDEFQKMKQELEAEYLATFKKTVAMHEVFLQRLAAHPKLRMDYNFKTFLEYKNSLNVRGKSGKERVSGLFKSLTRSADNVLSATHKDEDEYFQHQKSFLTSYNVRIRDTTLAADRYTRVHKGVADTYIKLSSAFAETAAADHSKLSRHLSLLAELFEKLRKFESRASSDCDLKLSDTLRYYMRDSGAAKDLLTRRQSALAHYDNANKAVDKARSKGRDIDVAESQQQKTAKRFDEISEESRNELKTLEERRIAHFKKNLTEHAELQIKHAQSQIQLLDNCIQSLRSLA